MPLSLCRATYTYQHHVVRLDVLTKLSSIVGIHHIQRVSTEVNYLPQDIMAGLMTSTMTCSSTLEHAQRIAASSSEKPERRTLLQPLRNTVDEDPKKALAAIRHKSSNPFPKNLRRALGRCLVEKPYCQDGYRMSSLKAFEEPPEHIPKGTPGKAQPGIRPRPPWLTELSIERRPEYGIDTIHLTPYTVLDLSIKVLKSSVPTAVGELAFHLLQRVEEKGLLRGYSAVALVGGCLQFASYVLQRPLHYSHERLASTGLKISPHTTRSSYNALW